MSKRNDRNRRHERGDFTCIHCKRPVHAASFGTDNRNHCPHCLWSRHVDEQIGDRLCTCRGPMEPIALASPDHKGGEWMIVHRCTRCSQLRLNRIAGDDDEVQLLRLALQPLARPAFPLDGFRAGVSGDSPWSV